MRQVIIAFADQAAATKVRTLLINSGLPVRGTCQTGAQILQMAADTLGGGVVVCPIRFQDMTAQELISLLPEDFDLLVFVTSRQQTQIFGSGIFTLTQPVTAATIVGSVRQLLETRQLKLSQVAHAVSEVQPPAKPQAYEPEQANAGINRSTDDKKMIDQAKYLLMNRRRMSEQDAHRYLQRRSMETGINMIDLAMRILRS